MNKLFIFLIACIFFSTSVIAIGVLPSVVSIDNALRGETVPKELIVVDIPINSSVVLSPSGAAASWLKLPAEYTIVATQQHIPFEVYVPHDVPNGVHEAAITVSVLSSSTDDISIKTGVKVKVNIEVSDRQVRSLSVHDIQLHDGEEAAPLLFDIALLNEGNVRDGIASLKVFFTTLSGVPKGNLDINFIETIPPFSFQTVSVTKDHSLVAGEYVATVVAYDGEKTLLANRSLPFTVFSKGFLSKEVVLDELILPAVVQKNLPLKIEVVANNSGDIPVIAKVVAEIFANDVLVATQESDSLEIIPSQSTEFVVYYTPSTKGTLTVSAKVVYDMQVTNSVTSMTKITGNAAQEFLKKGVPLFSIILVALLIFILLSVRSRSIGHR